MEDAEYETMYRVEETHWWYRALHQLLIGRLSTHVPGWEKKKILDAGCGTGALLQLLGGSPTHVGADLSEKAVALCRRRALPEIIQCDINHLPYADGWFDAIICSSVLYHRWVPDVSATLSEFRRVLKPGGILLFNVPAFSSLHSVHDEKVFTARRFLRHEVDELLINSRFEVVECAYWTSLLFPCVWAARRLSLVAEGRDFNRPDHWRSTLVNRSLGLVMAIELSLLKWMRFPAGVSIYGVARKNENSPKP